MLSPAAKRGDRRSGVASGLCRLLGLRRKLMVARGNWPPSMVS